MTDLRIISNRDLDADGILHRCRYAVPVSCNVDAAIAAHGRAGERAQHALRAVIMASAPTLTDLRKQVDYLAELPETAWAGSPGRQSTLDALRRLIAWRQAG